MEMDRNADNDTAYQRARSSIDVVRPAVEPSILGIPQGWEDDPSVHLPSDTALRHAKRLPIHLTPLRQRVKLASLGPKPRQTGDPANPHEVPAPSAGLSSGISAAAPRTSPGNDQRERPTQAPLSRSQGEKVSGLFETSRKRNWGESVYRVGYEREILDTEARLHETMLSLFGKHCLAEFEQPPKRILDLGTGLGLWPIAVASIWKNAHVVGFDRAPYQINPVVLEDAAKGRVTWIQGDFLEPLPFDSGSFDYVHMRFVGLGVPEDSWPSLLDEACRVLRPGGKLEIIDLSYQSSTSIINSFSSFLLLAGVADTPARPINFVLPMLDNLRPTSIRPIMGHEFEQPPGALRDAVPLWMASTLDYSTSIDTRPATCHETCRSLGWCKSRHEIITEPLHLVAWALTRV